MAYKDKKKQAANGRKWYLAHKELTLARTAARKTRIRQSGEPPLRNP